MVGYDIDLSLDKYIIRVSIIIIMWNGFKFHEQIDKDNCISLYMYASMYNKMYLIDERNGINCKVTYDRTNIQHPQYLLLLLLLMQQTIKFII